MNKETINEYYLERYALGELPDEETQEIRRSISTRPDLLEALDDIQSSNNDILALYPPKIVMAGLVDRLEKTPQKTIPLRRILAISSVAATFLILFLVLPLIKKGPGITGPEIMQDSTLVKGIPAVDLSKTQLLVYRKIQDRVEILTDGEKAGKGDLLQLAYVTAEDPYGMILSIDGRGLVTVHFPQTIGDPTALEMNKQSLLVNAIELDDAPDFERFFFLTSETPIDVDTVLTKVQDQAGKPQQVKRSDLDLPENFKQYSILILKGESS